MRTISLILVMLAITGMVRSQEEKPHIIFIMTDQHRGDALGVEPGPEVFADPLPRPGGESTVPGGLIV